MHKFTIDGIHVYARHEDTRELREWIEEKGVKATQQWRSKHGNRYPYLEVFMRKPEYALEFSLLFGDKITKHYEFNNRNKMSHG